MAVALKLCCHSISTVDAFELRDAADAGVHDTTQHLHDRACTHESGNVQSVPTEGREGGDAHCDARVCETRSLTRLCMSFEMRDARSGRGNGKGACIGRACADGEGDGC